MVLLFVYQLSLSDLFWNMFGSVISEPQLRVWMVRAERIILHPQYDPRGENNIFQKGVKEVHVLIEIHLILILFLN